MKMFIVGNQRGDSDWFKSVGFTPVKHLPDADIVQFMGGEDVSPELYGEKNTNSFNNFDRDFNEMAYFQWARQLGKPMAGICRGGQFLNVMCGGKMMQDVSNHTRSHEIDVWIDGKKKIMMATSTHHQMMVPSEDANLIAYATLVTGSDPEIVLYEEQKCLCFQPHPEYGVYPELGELYVELIKKFLL